MMDKAREESLSTVGVVTLYISTTHLVLRFQGLRTKSSLIQVHKQVHPPKGSLPAQAEFD